MNPSQPKHLASLLAPNLGSPALITDLMNPSWR